MNRFLASLFALLTVCLSSQAQVNPLRYNRYTTNLDSAQINGVNLTNIQADNVTGLPAITNALNVKVLTNSANIVIVSNNLQTVSNSLVALTTTVGGLVSTNDANTNKLIASASGRGTNTLLTTATLAAPTVTGNALVTGPILVSNASARWVGGTNSFTVGSITNGVWFGGTHTNATLYNGVNLGNAFVSSGAGQNSLQLGDGAESNGDFSVAIGVTARVVGEAGTATGNDSFADERGAAYGNESVAGPFAAAFGSGTIAVSNASGAFGQNAQAIHPFSTTIGYLSITTQTNQIMLGGSQNQYVYANGRMTARDGYTNAMLTGTNLVRGDIAIERTNVVSLANGNNAGIPTLGKSYIKVSGPSAAFNVNGLANGRDGKIVLLENNTGFPMTIANNSGIDGTAGNRIFTGTSGDLTYTNQPTLLIFAYDSEVSRWVLANYSTNSSGASGSFLPLAGGTMTGTITFDDAVGDPIIFGTGGNRLKLRYNAGLSTLDFYDDGSESVILSYDWSGAGSIDSFSSQINQSYPDGITNTWSAGGNPMASLFVHNGDSDSGDVEFKLESPSVNDVVWRIPAGTSNFVVSGEAIASDPTGGTSLTTLNWVTNRYDANFISSTPTTGNTVSANDNHNGHTIYITPAGTLSALTIAFPSNAESELGQEVVIICTQTITTLTLSQQGGGGTFMGFSSGAAAPDSGLWSMTYRKVAANTWARVSYTGSF